LRSPTPGVPHDLEPLEQRLAARLALRQPPEQLIGNPQCPRRLAGSIKPVSVKLS